MVVHSAVMSVACLADSMVDYLALSLVVTKAALMECLKVGLWVGLLVDC